METSIFNNTGEETIQLLLGSMENSDTKCFLKELERIKKKYTTKDKPCKFKIITERSSFPFTKQVSLEANINMVSAYIKEQIS